MKIYVVEWTNWEGKLKHSPCIFGDLKTAKDCAYDNLCAINDDYEFVSIIEKIYDSWNYEFKSTGRSWNYLESDIERIRDCLKHFKSSEDA